MKKFFDLMSVHVSVAVACVQLPSVAVACVQLPPLLCEAGGGVGAVLHSLGSC